MAPIRRGQEEEEEEEEEAQAAQLRADTLRLLAVARGEDPGDTALDIRLEDGLVVAELARDPSSAQPQEEERHSPFHEEQQLALDALEDQVRLSRPPRRGLPEATQEILAHFGLRGPEGDHPCRRRRCRAWSSTVHTVALSEALKEMRALPDARYDLYSCEFFEAYLQSPRPVDPPSAAAGVNLPELAASYPYLADEVARLTRLKTAEQREAVGRGLLGADAAKLASLEERFREAVWAGKEAMVGKLCSEVRYAKARLQAEAMAEKIKAASSTEKS